MNMKRALSALFLFACTHTAVDSSNITETGDLKTKVTYDHKASMVLISFAEALTEGQTLHLDVRRGDLRAPALKTKDCSLVAQQPIATFQAGEAHGDRAVYQVKL